MTTMDRSGLAYAAPASKGPQERAILATLPDSPRLHRVLEAVKVMMIAEGSLHLSTAEIAARLRCSKSTLYKLAPNADGLFELVVRLWIAEGEDELEQRLAAATSWSDRLTAFLSAVVYTTSQASSRFLQDVAIVTRANQLIDKLEARREETLRGIIEGGVAASEFRPVDARLVAKLVIMTVEGVCNSDLLAEVGLSASDAIWEAWKVLQTGILPRSEVSRPREILAPSRLS